MKKPEVFEKFTAGDRKAINDLADKIWHLLAKEQPKMAVAISALIMNTAMALERTVGRQAADRLMTQFNGVLEGMWEEAKNG